MNATSLEPILKIGEFPRDMQLAIDGEFECFSEEQVLAS